MNRREIVELLKVLADNYPNNKISDPEGTVKTWELNLGAYEAKDIYMAAKLYMGKCSYFPNPADLIKEIPRAQLLYNLEIQNTKQLKAENAKEPETGCWACAYNDTCTKNRCIV